MGTLDWLSDNLIELRGPVDIASNVAFGSGSTVSAKLYDTALDCRAGFYRTVTTADALSTATSVSVQDRTPFFVGDLVGISQDDGTEIRATITSLPGGDLDINFSGDSLTADSSKGSTVRRLQLSTTSTFITLDNWDGWENNMNMEITVNGGALIEKTVTFIDRDSGYATLSSTLGTAVDVGNVIKRKIGANISMSAFGVFPTSNPVIGDPAWGFRGTIASTHADIALGMRIRGEITAVDATSGANLTRKAVSTVINK